MHERMNKWPRCGGEIHGHCQSTRETSREALKPKDSRRFILKHFYVSIRVEAASGCSEKTCGSQGGGHSLSPLLAIPLFNFSSTLGSLGSQDLSHPSREFSRMVSTLRYRPRQIQLVSLCDRFYSLLLFIQTYPCPNLRFYRSYFFVSAVHSWKLSSQTNLYSMHK